MSGTGSQSQIHANPSADDSCSEDASKIHDIVGFMPDSEEEVCIPQMTVNIPLSTFGMSPANRSGQRTDPARTERLLRSVQQTVQFSNIDEKPMMVIQAAATYSIAREGERSKHWAKESHGKTRERQTVQTLATYPTDAESRKPGYVVITGNHPLLSTQALVSASDTDESDTDIVNMEFKYARAQARNVTKHLVLRLWQQYISKTRDGMYEKYFNRSPAAEIENLGTTQLREHQDLLHGHPDGYTENLYLELDHGDALDAAGLEDDGGPAAEQFLDRRRGARAGWT